jgi:hypothetical protein
MKRIWMVLGAFPAAALAHHGWSEYDSTKLLSFSGKIVESGYTHPHGHMRLEAGGTTWNVVLAPPSRMQSRGLPPERIAKGGTATVEGYASRSKPGEMRAERIIVGGKPVELR